jgi:hypothetical protein
MRIRHVCGGLDNPITQCFAEGGFKVTGGVKDKLDECVFLGCRPWHTSEGIKLGRSPGRAMIKQFWQRMPDAQPRVRAYQIADATHRAYGGDDVEMGFVPALRAFSAGVLRLTSDCAVRAKSRVFDPLDLNKLDVQRARAPCRARATEATIEQFCRIYSVDSQDLFIFENSALHVDTLNYVFSGPIPEALLRVDDL